MEEESFPHPGNALHQLGDQPGQTGDLRGSEVSAAVGLRRVGQRETSTMVLANSLHSPARDARLPVPAVAGYRNSGVSDRPGERT